MPLPFYISLLHGLSVSCPKKLLERQVLKYAYVDIILMVSKMFRGHLTAGVLAIGVTVVLISVIDTNCGIISA